jgi:hypothetical protein
VVASVVAIRLLASRSGSPAVPVAAHAGCSRLESAFSHHASGEWLSMSGRVSRLLPDQNGRYLHQRFIVRCTSGLTVLIVNDVSIGKRAPVRPGAEVAVAGQYIWNRQGGLIHFTHHASGGQPGGWILYAGRLYALVDRLSHENT